MIVSPNNTFAQAQPQDNRNISDKSVAHSSNNNALESNQKGTDPEELPDIILGSPTAKVTLIEYSSINCVHCALFHLRDFPKIKTKFIDRGHVRYIYRHFALDHQAVIAMGLIALAPEKEWFDKIALAYDKMPEWINSSPEKLAEICKIKNYNGHNTQQQKKLIDQVMAKRFNAEKKYDIPATPFFIIVRNNKEEILKGELTLRILFDKLK